MTYGRACNHQPVTHITEFKQGLQSVPASGSFFPQKALQVVFYFRSLFHHTITGNDFLHADSEKKSGGVGIYIDSSISYQIQTDIPNALNDSESL